MRKTVPLKQVIETVIYLQIFDETEPCLLFINIEGGSSSFSPLSVPISLKSLPSKTGLHGLHRNRGIFLESE